MYLFTSTQGELPKATGSHLSEAYGVTLYGNGWREDVVNRA